MQHGTYLFVLPWQFGAAGGVNQVVSELYRQFERSGTLSPRILIPDWEELRPVDSIDFSGARVTRMRLRPPFENRWLPYELAKYAAAFPGELQRLATVVHRHDVRVVNCHYVGPHALAWLTAKAVGVFAGKIVLSLHGLDIRTLANLKGVRRAIWRRALEAADVVVACSIGLAEETIAAFGLSGNNVVTIHNGVDAERLEILCAGTQRERRAGGPQLVNLGTFEHKKGHDLLLKAFGRVVDRFPGARLTIMGRTAEALPSTRALLRDLELEDSVTLIPDAPHEVALAMLRDADLFVLPSRNEAFSVALLEAGAMAKPVVASRVCGVPELIEDRRTGILVPPEDIDALAAGIAEMLSNTSTAQAYGEALRRRVLEEFRGEATFHKYFALVNEESPLSSSASRRQFER